MKLIFSPAQCSYDLKEKLFYVQNQQKCFNIGHMLLQHYLYALFSLHPKLLFICLTTCDTNLEDSHIHVG